MPSSSPPLGRKRFMSSPALRPTFRLPLSQPPEAAMNALQAHLETHHASIQVQRAGRHMTLTVSPAARHFWSPWLNLEFESPAQSIAETSPPAARSSLHARFSPAPSLWTALMVVYFSLATTGFFAVMWALAQWTMGRPPAALWVTSACAAGGLVLWWVSQIGQKLAREQMHLLHHAVEHALPVSPDPPPQS